MLHRPARTRVACERVFIALPFATNVVVYIHYTKHMTTLVKALNKIENLFIALGAKKEDAEEAIYGLSEVYENKLATKDDITVVRSEITSVVEQIKSVEKRLDLLTTVLVIGIVGLFIQNLVT